MFKIQTMHGDWMLDVHVSVKFIFIELTLKGSACGSNLHPLTIESLNCNSMYESRNVNPIISSTYEFSLFFFKNCMQKNIIIIAILK